MAEPKKTKRPSVKAVKEVLINRDNYPEEYRFLSSQEKDFLNHFAKDPAEYLYGNSYRALEDVILLFS